MHLGRFSTDARPARRCTRGSNLENAADATLCHRWRDRHDISAAGQLAKRHRRIVVELAEIHRASGLPWDDLTGEGQLGLMHALCRFDPDQRVGFTTYATWWVAFTLREYVLKNAPSPFGRLGEPRGNHQRGVAVVPKLGISGDP